MDTITVGEAVRMINRRGGAYLLAVMEPSEFAADHLPGSLRFAMCDPYDDDCLLSDLRNARRHPRLIVYSATSGPEAYQAAQWLEEFGLGPVHVLSGGMETWVDSGYASARDLGEDRLTISQAEMDRRLASEFARADG